MPRVLVTAFGPYGGWQENASWLAIVELTRNLPSHPEITTRLLRKAYVPVRSSLIFSVLIRVVPRVSLLNSHVPTIEDGDAFLLPVI